MMMLRKQQHSTTLKIRRPAAAAAGSLIFRQEEKMKKDPTTLIRVRAQQHPPVTYLMGPNSLLKHVLRNYCTRNSLLYESKRFLDNGNRVRQNHTPADLGMEDGDAIDAVSHMLGGGAAVT
ncbi:small ubiquitin-related modifier 2 [Prunus yedoensis var. nudiflora]|uniref:Small ubiquitin-related modifier 2 n=1 Tax=Prunus yedoensis var. nudiflora TaxID=2094558 RepID=A0A314ZCL5_PRUYE|nr:small ubiquitin-related modifier 2 [Prunus yedoensis var. nudiflora]